MGTRSRIGVMHGDKLKSVYCHWDGYLAHNGKILQEHFDSAKANNLVALGDLSSLRPNIGEQHAFSYHDLPADEVEAFKEATKDMCTFYGRDRGESGTEFKVAYMFEEFLEQCDNCDAEYYYIMKDGVWYCGRTYSHSHPLSRTLTALTEALAAEEEKETA
jgi:hypothetical protein